MKKTIALLLALALMLPAAAWACTETTVLVAKSTATNTYTYTDSCWWTLTEDCRIAGIKDADEAMWHAPVQHAESQYVSGNLDNGWARINWYVRTVTVGCNVIGLKRLDNVTTVLFPDCYEIALDAIRAIFGEDAEVSNNAISAGATWWDGDYAATIFFPSYSDRFQIGWVYFNNGEDRTPLYLGHFDEELRFGLACGWWIPEPEQPKQTGQTNCQTGSPATATATATATSSSAVNVSNSGSVNNSGDGCWRNNTVLQINIGIVQTVKNCIRWLKGECQ